MAQEIDWLSSQAGMCKVNLYSPSGQKEQERKVICFVDVSHLNTNDRRSATGHHPAGDVDLGSLEEKEVIIIKDDEQCNHMNTEGAVCLFKQGSSEDVNVVSWLSNDLQKYAVGFKHALTPSGTPRKTNSFDSPIADKASQNNNNTAPSASVSDRENPDDLAYYAHKLCSLVVEMTQKEIKDKWESSGKCIRQTISPHSARTKPPSTEGVEASKLPQERSVRIEDPFQSERANQNVFKETERYSDAVKKNEDFTSVSKGMMVCANQVASDMMLSFLKTMKVQKGKQHPQPACAVLKEVLMRHTKEIVSDFIDSSMKNLHNITGALMTDSDFVCAVKKNLYNVGTQKTMEILEAMVKRLFKLLEDKTTRSQNLAFASFKTGAQGNQRTQGMQFASLKSESPILGKDRGGGPTKSCPSGSRGPENQVSLDVYAKEILVSALTQIQQHLLEKSRDLGHHESNASSFGYIHHDQNHDRAPGSYSPKPREGRPDFHQSEVLKDKASLILSMVQKILHEAGLNLDGNQNRR